MSIIRDRVQVVLAAVVLLLLATNIFLIVRNLQLQRTIEQSKLFIVDEGYKFSDLKINRLDGREEVFSFSERKLKTLLFVFNTSCRYCVQQYPYWRELVAKLDNSQWRVVAVTSEENLDKIKEHVAEYKLQNVIVGSMSQADIRQSRLMYTPMTLVVDVDGGVKKVWPGLWTKPFDLPD